MALGLRDLRGKGLLRKSGSGDGSGRMTMEKLTKFLDGFYMNRIAIRFLFNQHLQLFASPSPSPSSSASHNEIRDPDLDIVGSIEMNCDVGQIAKDAAASAQYVTIQITIPPCPFFLFSPKTNSRILMVVLDLSNAGG